tara:strand:+ start:2850 stop:3026 length:177 start_codon:yes stop_codon:yes gene_type:complete
MKEKNYNTIKFVLRSHIKNKVDSLWTWQFDNFTCLYNTLGNKLRIFTAQQLLDKINES